MFRLFIFLAKLINGFSVNDDQLLVSIHSVSFKILMPIDRHSIVVEVGNSLLGHIYNLLVWLIVATFSQDSKPYIKDVTFVPELSEF